MASSRERCARQGVTVSWSRLAARGDDAAAIVVDSRAATVEDAQAELQRFADDAWPPLRPRLHRRGNGDEHQRPAAMHGRTRRAIAMSTSAPSSADRARRLPLRRRRAGERRRQPAEPHAARTLPACGGLADRRHRVPRARARAATSSSSSCDKAPGHGRQAVPAAVRLFRRLRPAIVHTRNLAALEASVPAWLPGVPVRIHGEHGRDVGDLDGTNRTYRCVRRALSAVRQPLRRAVARPRALPVEPSACRAARVTSIYNGVDTERFAPARGRVRGRRIARSTTPASWMCGTVGRMQPVKNQVTARARVRARAGDAHRRCARGCASCIVGDGPLRAKFVAILRARRRRRPGVAPRRARRRRRRAAQARRASCCPSLAEGISNTILEAMASGLAGHRDRRRRQCASWSTTDARALLVPPATPSALAQALAALRERRRTRARTHGRAGRARAERLYSLDAMVARYARSTSVCSRGRASGTPCRASRRDGAARDDGAH